MAIECSVTVSMGDETNGVLREMFRVTGVSRETSDAAKPGINSQKAWFHGPLRVVLPMYPGSIRKSLYVRPPRAFESKSVCASMPSLIS